MVDEALPDVVAGGGTGAAAVDAEQHEVGSARDDVDGERPQGVDDPLALGDDLLDAGVHLVDVGECQPAGGLLGGVEVVRQDHLLQLGDDPRRGDGVAEPGRRHAPRLGERAHDDEWHVVADEVQRRPVGELGVGLVDDDEARRGVEQHTDHRRVLDQARRVVR